MLNVIGSRAFIMRSYIASLEHTAAPAYGTVASEAITDRVMALAIRVTMVLLFKMGAAFD